MNELRIGSVALLLLVSIPALAQNRRTDTALIELGRGCDSFKGGFQVVLNGAEWDRTDAHLEDGRWVWRKTSAPRFATIGSVASLRAGPSRTYCRRSEYDRWKNRDVASFRFYCDTSPVQALKIDTHTATTVITAFRNLPPDPAGHDALDCRCLEMDSSGGTLDVDGLRLPGEVLLLRFLPWDGLGPGLRVFATTSQRLPGGKAFDGALCPPRGCTGNEVHLTRDRLVNALGKQRLLNAQAAPNAYDVDHLLNRDVQKLTLTVK